MSAVKISLKFFEIFGSIGNTLELFQKFFLRPVNLKTFLKIKFCNVEKNGNFHWKGAKATMLKILQ